MTQGVDTPPRLPDFIIIGAQRCGTTSLFNYLARHPQAAPARRKEVHFFDLNYEKGIRWYGEQFPPRRAGQTLAFEASPYYLFHPQVPKRVRGCVTSAKLIVLLRNPIDRAYSHYHWAVTQRCETMPFETAIEREGERLRGERERLLLDGGYYSFPHQHFSYRSRGIYIDQLLAWTPAPFPREQVLVVRSEDLYSNPAPVFRSALDFVGLDAWEPPEYEKHNDLSYQAMSPGVRERLIDFFRPHNQRLYEFLGRDLKWDH